MIHGTLTRLQRAHAGHTPVAGGQFRSLVPRSRHVTAHRSAKEMKSAFPQFERPCLDAFRFLVERHGFKDPIVEQLGRECFIRYEKENKMVSIAYEPYSVVNLRVKCTSNLRVKVHHFEDVKHHQNGPSTINQIAQRKGMERTSDLPRTGRKPSDGKALLC